MKRLRISMLAVIAAVACFAFTRADKGIGPDCDATLFYFKVTPSLNLQCGQVTLNTQFDYSVNTIDDGDNVPEASEVILDISDNDPYACPDATTIACSLGYTASQLEKNPSTGKWRPIATEVTAYQCCVRKSN